MENDTRLRRDHLGHGNAHPQNGTWWQLALWCKPGYLSAGSCAPVVSAWW